EERTTREALREEFDRIESEYAEADALPDEIDERLVSPPLLSGNRRAARSCPGWHRATILARRRGARRPPQTIGPPIRRSPSISAASSSRSARSRLTPSSSARTGCAPMSSRRTAARRR